MAGVTLNNWVTFDVTTVVKGPGTYSFAVDSPAGGASNNVFTAMENNKRQGPSARGRADGAADEYLFPRQ